ncbi:MAG: polyamine aminopropyltransferase [Alphaproteobacteria bacterium]|jgi:spermidine synthase|nr:polyamine aminopropyltransferase [Alphaproteobacteria bacterium]
MTDWYRETLHAHIAQELAIDRVVYRQRTEHQDLVIFDNGTYGRVLALDGVAQTTTRDEFIYHEMLVHVPLVAHGSPKRVLIIGGGDGGTLRRALEHPIERAVMVELDRTVVDLSVEYMPELSAGAFDDPRTELLIADGCRFVKETAETFDAIIIDSTDPVGPGAVLFTAEFFADCKRLLNPGGVFVNQGGVPWVQSQELATFFPRLKALYADASVFSAAVPLYIGGIMTFGFATDDPGLRRQPVETLAARYRALGLKTGYYSPAMHAAAFALPPFVESLIAGAA